MWTKKRIKQFQRLKRLHESGIIRLHVSGSQVLNDLRDEESGRDAQKLIRKINMRRHSASCSFTLKEKPNCLDFSDLRISSEENYRVMERKAQKFTDSYRRFLNNLGKKRINKKNEVVDMNHLISSYLSESDIFLTNDKYLVRFGEAEGEELRICIQTPEIFLAEYEALLYKQLSRLLR